MSDEMKQDVQKLKTDVAELRGTDRRIALTLTRIEGKVDGVKRDMVTRDDFSTLMKRMDGFSGMLQDSRWDWGKQKVRLDEHERRISSLETKRA